MFRGGRIVAGIIRSLVNARGVQLECARMLYEGLLILVLLYVIETIIWREEERSRIRTMQMDNLRGFLGIRRMDRVLIRELFGVDERVEESILRWFGYIERMENDIIVEEVY